MVSENHAPPSELSKHLAFCQNLARKVSTFRHLTVQFFCETNVIRAYISSEAN